MDFSSITPIEACSIFGKESTDYFSFGAEGGELNYYFIAGPEPKEIISDTRQ